MKKFVAVVLVMVLVCGCALASSYEAKDISKALGVDYIYLGGTSVIGSFINSEVPNRTMIGILAPNGEYVIEYCDRSGTHYAWYDSGDFYENGAIVTATLGAAYDSNLVLASFFVLALDNEAKVSMLSPIKENENSYTNSDEFCSAIATQLVLYGGQ